MHSSGMRTARLLIVSFGAYFRGGGASICNPSMFTSTIFTSLRIHPLPYSPPLIALWDGCTPPPVNRMTNKCKNITFPQLRLRVVMIQKPEHRTWTGRHRELEWGSLSLCPGQLNSEQRRVRLALYSVLREIYWGVFSVCDYGTKLPS